MAIFSLLIGFSKNVWKVEVIQISAQHLTHFHIGRQTIERDINYSNATFSDRKDYFQEHVLSLGTAKIIN